MQLQLYSDSPSCYFSDPPVRLYTYNLWIENRFGQQWVQPESGDGTWLYALRHPFGTKATLTCPALYSAVPTGMVPVGRLP